MIKWKAWPSDSCSWAPSDNLTPSLLECYDNPPVNEKRLQKASAQFAAGVVNGLKSGSFSPFNLNIDLDIWRHITYQKGKPCNHKGQFLFWKNDFNRLSKYLSSHWFTALMDMAKELL